MNIDVLRKQLEIDEGVVHEIYLDHLGLPTFGIGHLVTESDPEHGQAVGFLWRSLDVLKPSNKISKQQCQSANSYTQTLMICQKKLNKL